MTGTITSTTVLSPSAVQGFASTIKGDVVQPGDSGYDDARRVFNAMIDRYPKLIAYCTDQSDVIAAIEFARDQKLPVAVRGGGHNGPGLGVVDGGLVIDLSRMNDVQVDPVKRTARVGGGAIWSQVDAATHAHGLATPSGIIASTGVGGLTLGGGLGHLTRKFGLSIDNLMEVDMVLADGRAVTANASEFPDLFWAIRGGGGNFGVVTAFTFRLHPIDTVYAGPMLWPMEKADEIMRWYRDFLPQAQDDLNGFFAFLIVPPGPPFPEELHSEKMCGIVWCYTGPLDQAESVFAPIRTRFGAPALDWVGPIPHPALQGMFDPLYPSGHHWYWKADFFNELTDEAITRHVKYGKELPTAGPGTSTMHLYPIDGAAGRVPKDATAWNYRDAKWAEVIVGVNADPADSAATTEWAKTYWSALHPYSAGGAYINMMMEEGDQRIRATYGSNYDRLSRIKAKYDPSNFFRSNQNILPKA